MASDDTRARTDQSTSTTIGATSDSTSKTGAAATTGTSRNSTDVATTTDITTRMTEWRLGDAEIQADLDRGVAIVRTKDSIVGAPTGNPDDELIKTMVKGKLQADSETSKATIDVDSKSGEVTLTGSADSASQIGRAIALALDTQGVTKVSSELKVSMKAKQ